MGAAALTLLALLTLLTLLTLLALLALLTLLALTALPLLLAATLALRLGALGLTLMGRHRHDSDRRLRGVAKV